MGNIGAEIASGAAGALWKMVTLVPLSVWLVVMVALIAVVFVMRYATNWKVDLFAIVGVAIVGTIMSYRAHWIEMGYAEAQGQVKQAQAQMEGYKKTEALIEACYTHDGNVWDRTQGKCLHKDGS